MEVEIETRRDPEAPSHRVVIWVVVDAGEVFVRSVRGTRGRWFRELTANPEAILHVGAPPSRFAALPGGRHPSVERCSTGLRRKYGPGASLALDASSGRAVDDGALGPTMSDRRTLAAFLAVVLLAGLNPVAVRLSNAELAPFWGAGSRFLVAAGVFWLVVVVRRRPLPRGRAWLGPIAYGLLAFALFFTLIYWGLQQAHATTGAVALALVPLLTLLLAIAQRQEPYRARGLVGAAVSVVGIVIVFGDQLGGAVSLASLLALVGAAAAAAEAGIVVRWFPRSDPFVTNAIGMTVGFVVLLVLSLSSGEAWVAPTQVDTWLAIGYMVTFGSVGVFWLSLRVLREWPASRASYQFLLMPLVTIVVASVLVGETPSVMFVLGGAVALLGVYLGAFWGRRSAAAAAPAAPVSAAPATQGGAYAVAHEQPLPNC